MRTETTVYHQGREEEQKLRIQKDVGRTKCGEPRARATAAADHARTAWLNSPWLRELVAVLDLLTGFEAGRASVYLFIQFPDRGVIVSKNSKRGF